MPLLESWDREQLFHLFTCYVLHGSDFRRLLSIQLGITTDAVLELMGLPGLILAHLGLPLSHVTQIRTAVKQKLSQEEGLPLDQSVPMKRWSMVEFVKDSLDRRRAEVGVGREVERQRAEIRRIVESDVKQVWGYGRAIPEIKLRMTSSVFLLASCGLSSHRLGLLPLIQEETMVGFYDISSTLNKELIAWQLRDKLSSFQPRPRSDRSVSGFSSDSGVGNETGGYYRQNDSGSSRPAWRKQQGLVRPGGGPDARPSSSSAGSGGRPRGGRTEGGPSKPRDRG